MRIHAIKTGDVLVKSAFLGTPAKHGIAPYLANVFVDRHRVRLPILTWLIEHPEGLIVVDTGENVATKTNFITQTTYDLTPEDEIGNQLKHLGIATTDIAKVVLTHLHGDHIDGLKDFPTTPIWVSQREYSPLQTNGWNMSKLGIHLPASFNPMQITFRPEPFGPFDYSFPLTRDGRVIAVPTPGHTAGHMSVIVIDDDRHYFIAGDVSYNERGMVEQQLVGPSRKIALHRDTLQRVNAYTGLFPTVYLPSHDPESAQRLATKQTTGKVLAFADRPRKQVG
jgi:N-acyl homoserine lactone hydrolase